ncbi:DUF2878 domain-containing protein [Marinobacter hydrocarbonoclasticus]|nr:DUF2878 domain-containing protein [Marinobacter nauticus]
MTRRQIAILVLFDVVWALAVFGQHSTVLWQALLTALMVVLATGMRTLALAIAVSGVALDAVLIQYNVLSMAGTPSAMPLHLALLWLGFGLALAACRKRMPQSPVTLALLGGALGSLGYYLGERFGALELAPTTAAGVAIIGLCWAVLFPLCRTLFSALAPNPLGGKS